MRYAAWLPSWKRARPRWIACVGMACLLFSSLVLVGSVAAAVTNPFPDAHWDVGVRGGTPVVTNWNSVTVPLSGGRALITGLPGAIYLYEPNTRVRRVADAPHFLDSHFGAPLLDDRVLICGGQQDEEALDTCFIYDPVRDQWTEAARLPRGTYNFYTNIAAALPDGRVIVTGGSTNDDQVYDPVSERWFGLASRNVFIFDPQRSTTYPDGSTLPGRWEERQKMPPTRTFATHVPGPELGSVPLPEDKQGVEVGRVEHRTVVLADGRVLLIGGRWTQPADHYGIDLVDVYDPESDQWSRLQPLPPSDGEDDGFGGRSLPGVSILSGGDVLVFGGGATHLVEAVDQFGRSIFAVAGPEAPRRSAIVLDPTTGTWRRVGDLNFRRSGSLASGWPSGEGTFVFAIGGPSAKQDVQAEPEVYDSQTERWLPLLPEPGWIRDGTVRQGTGLTDGTVLTWTGVIDSPGFYVPVRVFSPTGRSRN